MHSAELNVPQNHVYLFKPHSRIISKLRQCVTANLIYGIMLKNMREQQTRSVA